MPRHPPEKCHTRNADNQIATSTEKRLKQNDVIAFMTAECCVPLDIHRNMTAVNGDASMEVNTVRSLPRTVKGDSLASYPITNQCRLKREMF